MNAPLDYLRRFDDWLEEVNQRPATRAAALAFIGANLYLLSLVLPIGQVIGPKWGARVFVTETAVMMYSGLHALYVVERAGGLEEWEAQFDES